MSKLERTTLSLSILNEIVKDLIKQGNPLSEIKEILKLMQSQDLPGKLNPVYFKEKDVKTVLKRAKLEIQYYSEENSLESCKIKLERKIDQHVQEIKLGLEKIPEFISLFLTYSKKDNTCDICNNKKEKEYNIRVEYFLKGNCRTIKLEEITHLGYACFNCGNITFYEPDNRIKEIKKIISPKNIFH